MSQLPNTAEIIILESDSEVTDLIHSLKPSVDEVGGQKLKEIVALMKKPLSVVIENDYIDRVFRDSYYAYFSSKHFDVDRSCKRITFFEGEISDEHFYSESGHEYLQQKVIGFAVIRPISPGCIGRTLLSPGKLSSNNSYNRTTAFSFVVLGVSLEVNAFPFTSQDAETMSCAETTVWNILEYYGERYPEYRIVNPSEILSVLSKNSAERVVPSRGLQYTQVASLLKEFGFAPRLYFSKAYGSTEFKRLFHYYVESGIPIGVAVLADYKGKQIGHSIVCIGHSKKADLNSNPPLQCGKVATLDSSDFYNEYVIMDDNQIPYKIQDFNRFTLYNNPKVNGFVVPLYKRINLEAGDARSIVMNILGHPQYGIDPSMLDFGGIHKYDDITNPLVVRLFLTSSRSYKHFKSLHLKNDYLSRLYTQLPMPKFIWVAELSLKSAYMEGNVLGELIIDATASRYNGLKSIVLLHYPGYVGWRLPNQDLTNLFDMLKLKHDDINELYPLYSNNLLGG